MWFGFLNNVVLTYDTYLSKMILGASYNSLSMNKHRPDFRPVSITIYKIVPITP
jgi:hypothetical protein